MKLLMSEGRLWVVLFYIFKLKHILSPVYSLYMLVC